MLQPARAEIEGFGGHDQITHIAVQEGLRCGSVMPRGYAPMPAAVRSYCENRRGGMLEYDHAIAKHLGDWIYGIQHAWDWNQERLEHYTWAAEKTKDIGAGSAHENLCRAVNRFAGIQPPRQDIELCMRVKALDADARERSGKVRT